MTKNNPVFHSNYATLPGTNLAEITKIAWAIYHEYEKKTRRKVYLKSNNKSYFKGAKIFLDNYFPHLKQKNPKDRLRRIKFFRAGLDLAQNNTYPPIIRTEFKNEIFMRFAGQTRDNKKFFVQIRKNTKDNHYFMSTFPDTGKK